MATAPKSKIESQKDSPSMFQSQSPDTTSFDYRSFQDVLGKMVEATSNLTIITSKLLDKNASAGFEKGKFGDDDKDCEPNDVVTEDSSRQQQRFKQSYPKLRNDNSNRLI